MKKLLLLILLPLFLAGLFIAVASFHPAYDTPPPSGWYQQFMPNLNGQYIKDITFLDSLTGYAITDLHYILKTTNSGDVWKIIHNDTSSTIGFTRVEFINQNTGFVSGGMYYSGTFHLLKTTNGGSNWFTINTPVTQYDMFVLNEDTIWITDGGGVGGMFRTTNGGIEWSLQYFNYGNNLDKIYMYNRNIGFACTVYELFKTTNSGLNWIQISGISQSNRFFDIYFADSLVGWRTDGDSMKITTDGGFNWSNQVLPHGGMLFPPVMTLFWNINRDTIWGTGGYILFPNNQARGLLYRTTNGGANWLFQMPDTSFNIAYHYINFFNRLNGWSYSVNPIGIHTTTGGDSVWYIGIVQQSREVPNNFILKQNYPNPFNPRTVIPYSLKSAGYVRIIAYDILGREVQRLVDQKQNAGEYEVDFMGKFCSSGVYFYRMTVDPSTGSGQAFEDTKKMILLK
ncbi:MAG: T9SS type A sorting domain-containing protein [Ignavibacteria bacterium]|jgi:photosystem II stability/assembly factor-like uncharacterized protein